MGSNTKLWRWLFLSLMLIVLLLSLANFCGYSSDDLRDDLPSVAQGTTSVEADGFIDQLGGPSRACDWFRGQSRYESEHLARLEVESHDTLDWARIIDNSSLDVTVEQMRDGFGWLLDNCWRE